MPEDYDLLFRESLRRQSFKNLEKKTVLEKESWRNCHDYSAFESESEPVKSSHLDE